MMGLSTARSAESFKAMMLLCLGSIWIPSILEEVFSEIYILSCPLTYLDTVRKTSVFFDVSRGPRIRYGIFPITL